MRLNCAGLLSAPLPTRPNGGRSGRCRLLNICTVEGEQAAAAGYTS